VTALRPSPRAGVLQHQLGPADLGVPKAEALVVRVAGYGTFIAEESSGHAPLP
jgi:hypothetical protein